MECFGNVEINFYFYCRFLLLFILGNFGIVIDLCLPDFNLLIITVIYFLILSTFDVFLFFILESTHLNLEI